MKNIFNQKLKKQQGAATLVLVVIVSAVALLMAIGATHLSLGELEIGFTSQKAGETLYVADGCAEEALERLRKNSSYGGETLNLGGGSCIISIVANGSSRTVTATATVGEFNKKIQVALTLNNGVVIINSWREVGL